MTKNEFICGMANVASQTNMQGVYAACVLLLWQMYEFQGFQVVK
jgi:hypothetical protein